MTGPEHYQQAEILLAQAAAVRETCTLRDAREDPDEHCYRVEAVRQMAAEAAVHAALAQVGATLDGAYGGLAIGATAGWDAVR